MKKQYPELITALDKYPVRIKTAKSSGKDELLVFYKKGKLYSGIYKYDAGTDKENPALINFEDAYEKIKCSYDEKGLNWNTDRFWNAYEKLKFIKQGKFVPSPEQSIEQKAMNNLRYLIEECDLEEIMPYKNFLRQLREDILDYGTLPDYTLRRIANLESNDHKIKSTVNEIESIQNDLGKDFLEKEKQRAKEISKEIIIAVENTKE